MGKPVSWLVKVGIAIAIIIMYVLFVVVGTNTFFAPPAYEKICPVETVATKVPPATQTACLAEGGAWQANPPGVPAGAGQPAGFCDLFSNCQKSFEAQMHAYAPRAFTVMVVAGVVGIVASFLIGVEAVSFGLLVGGVLLVLGSTVMFWGQINDVIRFVIVGVLLLFLIVLGWLKTRDTVSGRTSFFKRRQ